MTKELLFNKLHFSILCRCNYTYANKICKEISGNWSTVSPLLNNFFERGLIRKVKQGRHFIVELTDKGKIFVDFYNKNHKLLEAENEKTK